MQDLFTLPGKIPGLALMTSWQNWPEKGRLLAMNVQDLDFLHVEFIVRPSQAQQQAGIPGQ
jgi:hypothetical protein